MVKEVLDQDFNEVVLNSKIPVLVDLWAPWCGPCRMVSPVIEGLSDVYGDRSPSAR
jgi:thioredoxin 1